MKIRYYFYDKALLLITELLSLVLVDFFLSFSKLPLGDIILINALYIILHLVYHIYAYRKLKIYFEKLFDIANKLEEKSLICEFTEKPDSYELGLLYEVLEDTAHAVNDKIAESNTFKNEYKQYIESVIHEIKLPISVIKLISGKSDTQDFHSIQEEIESIQGYIEQVLYYARGDTVENDYFIAETNLDELVKTVIKKHKNKLIAKNIPVSLKIGMVCVLTDKKWLEFILSQLIDNAIKYSDMHNPQIDIFVDTDGNAINLYIRNRGLTIPPEDTDRVFQKGFTGKNGRNIQHSTGMGLFLVKNLSEKLGHKVSFVSDDEVTTFCICFNSLK